VIVRHRKENLKKCSLRGLETRADFLFVPYPLRDPLPCLDNYVVLSLEGPPLSQGDEERGLVLLDGTWRYAQKMAATVSHLPRRSLPSLQTAYPRRQEDCHDQSRGLASIEALFAAFHILGRPTEGLLDRYYWKERFLRANQAHFCYDHAQDDPARHSLSKPQPAFPVHSA